MQARSSHSTRLGVLLLAASLGRLIAAETVTPLRQAHSHNDYEHTRPLLDALDHGFCSVEADVWLVDGELLVAHDRDKVTPARTLQSLYLDPLRARVDRNGGRVHPGGPEFTLLIDFKSPADPTYDVLKNVLRDYAAMLARFEHGTVHDGAVIVIISGNRPFERIRTEPVRLAALDGRLSDLEVLPPQDIMPLISDNWRNHFEWDGTGKFPEHELERLQEILSTAHRNGRRVRFWAAPDIPPSWHLQKWAGVDLINTDKLAELSAFLSDPGNAAAAPRSPGAEE